MYKLDLEKVEEPESNCQHLLNQRKSKGIPKKKIFSASPAMQKPLTVWITTNCEKFFKRQEYMTCLLRNLYSGQEATVRTWHGTKDWFQTGKGVCQGCISSPCLFNLYAEYITLNAGLDDSQGGIKIAGRNIDNLSDANDSILTAESEKELKSFLMKVKEESEKLA